MKIVPHIVDDDQAVITVWVECRAIRIWTYADDIARRQNMRLAREYCNGWCHARDYFTPKDAA